MPLDIIGVSPFLCSGNRDKMVKKVVDYKLLNGKRYYKVKWECTWEQEDTLLTAQDLVDQFWGFVNRVKSEDDRIAVSNKPGLDERNTTKSDNKNEKNTHHDETVSCASNVHQEKSTNDKVEYPKQKSQNFHTDDVIRKTVNLKCGEELGEDNIISHPSMVTINPTRQAMQIPCNGKDTLNAPNLPQHPSSLFKRSYGMMDYNSEENFNHPHDIIDLKIKRQHINGKIVLDNEERRFQCHVCGMAFKRKDMCRRHLRTHSNDYCYFCAICKKGFIRRYVLVKHLNKDHQTDDQTKIISTKRRRRDEVKHEQPSMVPMPMKGDPHDVDSTLPGAPKYIMEPSDNLSIDEEHDYDKKTGNVVVVFKTESDDGKMESATDARSYDYSENENSRSYDCSERDESRCYEYSEKNDYRSYEYSEKDDSRSYECSENEEARSNEYSRDDSRSYEYSENDEGRSNEYSGKDEARSNEYSEKGNTNPYRYHEKDIDAEGNSTNIGNAQRQTQIQMQTQMQTQMESETPVIELDCMEAPLDNSSNATVISSLNTNIENNSNMKKNSNSYDSERSVHEGACRMVNRNNNAFSENVHATGAAYNSHSAFPVRHDNDSTLVGVAKYATDDADNVSIDDEHNYDKRTDVVVVLDTESDDKKMESDINTRSYEYSEKSDDTRSYDSRMYRYSGKDDPGSYEYSAKDDSRSYECFGKDNTNLHRYHEKDAGGAAAYTIANHQQTQMQTHQQTQMQTHQQTQMQTQIQTQIQTDTPITKHDCMEANLDISSKTAIISPLNNKVETNGNSMKKYSASHESERAVNEGGVYRMVNNTNISFPENVHNTCAPYNTNITFSGRETDTVNQTCQNS